MTTRLVTFVTTIIFILVNVFNVIIIFDIISIVSDLFFIFIFIQVNFINDFNNFVGFTDIIFLNRSLKLQILFLNTSLCNRIGIGSSYFILNFLRIRCLRSSFINFLINSLGHSLLEIGAHGIHQHTLGVFISSLFHGFCLLNGF